MARRRFTPEELRQMMISGPREQHRRNAEHLRVSAVKAAEKGSKAAEAAASLPIGSDERKLQEYWASYHAARAEHYAEQAEREDRAAQTYRQE